MKAKVLYAFTDKENGQLRNVSDEITVTAKRAEELKDFIEIIPDETVSKPSKKRT